MSRRRLGLIILSILLSCGFPHALSVHGQPVPPSLPAAPTSVDPITTAIPPTRATDPRAAEFAEKYNELQNLIFGLVEKHRDAKDDERKRIRDQIVELTTEQFDLRHQMRKVEIERIKKHLREVEAKVDKRETLKREIIKKRITELLDENAELRWDSPPIGGVGPQISTTTQMREMRMPDGSRRQGPVTSAESTKFPSLVGWPAVAEAKARLEIAERQLERVRSLAEQDAIARNEFNKRRDEVELAQLAFERASMEYAGRKKLLEVGVRRAEAELEKVQADLEESLSINQRSPGSIPATTIRRQTAAVEEKELALETAETLLDLHLLGTDRVEYVEGIVTLDGMPVADAMVTFVPVNDGQGMSATDTTDENGAFRVTVTGDVAAESSVGIPLGDYYVGVVKAIRPEMAEKETGVPQKYSNPRESGLRFTVKGGRNKIDIELTSE